MDGFSRNCASRRWASIALLLLATAATAGCSQAHSGPAGNRPAPRSAIDLLDEMATAYAKADSYADSGELVLQFAPQSGDATSEVVDFSVTFSRPDRVRMHCYQGTLVADGKHMLSTVAALPGQVLEQPCPNPLTLEALYADDIVRQALTEQVAGSSPQIALLLAPDFVKTVTAEARQVDLLPPQTIEDQLCDGASVERPDGRIIFWIDRQSLVLRRIEFPTQALQPALEEQLGGKLRELTLVAHFRGARLNEPVDEQAFAFEVPSDSKLVKRFDTRSLVPPPPELSKLLGKRIEAFSFAAADGSTITRESLAGKVVVVDFWATWCGPCRAGMPKLEEVYQKYKDDARVAFLAVSIDQPNVTDDAIRAAQTESGGTIPLARDTTQDAFKAFGIEGIPNLFVLGPDGTVEDNEVGFNEQLAAELPGRLEKLLAGQSIHADAVERQAQRVAAYEASLKEPLQDPVEPVIKPEIAVRSEPGALVMTPLWSTKEVAKPGNILVARDAEGQPRFFINSAWKSAAEVDATGKLVATHELPIPAAEVASYLRTNNESLTPLFVASASAQHQAHLIDDTWKLVTSYPADTSTEVSDSQLVDLDGDGKTEMAVGFWGTRGVELVSQNGEKIWNHGGIENVFRLQPVRWSDGAPRLLCVHGGGSLLVLDQAGQKSAEITVPKRFLRWVMAADLNGDGTPEFLGLSPIAEGRDLAIGFQADGTETFSYELPPGIHQTPIEPVIAAPLLDGTTQWVLAGSDGTVHILSADGTLIDRFGMGAPLTGMAAATINGQPALVVATADELSAWGLRRP